jgi:ribonucleotide reductase alpha subunit
METGTPYIVSAGRRQQEVQPENVGTIKSSNLCTEILEYSDSNETAVCNLASIALPAFVERTATPSRSTTKTPRHNEGGNV